MAADFDLDELIAHPDNRFVLINRSGTYQEALRLLKQNRGSPHWLLLVEVGPERFQAARFAELHKWARSQPKEALATEPLAGLPGCPLFEVGTVDDSCDRAGLLQAASASPLEAVVVVWEEAGMVYGLVSLSSLSASVGTAGPRAEAQKPAAPAAPEKPRPTQAGGKTKGAPAGSAGLRGRLRRLAEKYRINKIWAIVSFVVFVAFPVVWIVATDVLPRFQRPVMSGEWNIAVAGFTVVGDEPVTAADSRQISNVFFNHFSMEMDNLKSASGVSIQILGPDPVGSISGKTAEERSQNAASLAKQLKADLIVYGTIHRSGATLTLTPEFYVGIQNFYEIQEMVGYHSLGSDIVLNTAGSNIPVQINLNRELSNRSQSLALIAEGLSLYFVRDYARSYDYFRQADADELWNKTSGREVVELFEGNAALKAGRIAEAQQAYQASLQLNPQYARAYVGLGNAAYQQGFAGSRGQTYNPDIDLLDQALKFYDQASQAQDQPASADIPVKVAFGKGQVYIAKWFAHYDTQASARQAFQLVIDQYGDGKNPRIQELASESHARLGLMARQDGDLASAVLEFEAAEQIGSDPLRLGLYWVTLGDLYQQTGQTGQVAPAYRSALEQYNSGLTLVLQPDDKAEVLYQIARCHQKLGELDQAVSAAEQALRLSTPQSPAYQTYQGYLATLQAGK